MDAFQNGVARRGPGDRSVTVRWRAAAIAVLWSVLAGFAAQSVAQETGAEGAAPTPELGQEPTPQPPAEPGPPPGVGSSTSPEAQPGFGPPEAMRRYLDGAEFRSRYENKTIHLMLGLQHFGSEYYLPGDRSVWIGQGGPCQVGEWAYVTPQFCFQYETSGPHCWTVFDVDSTTFAQAVDGGLILRVYAIDEKPLSCDPELFG